MPEKAENGLTNEREAPILVYPVLVMETAPMSDAASVLKAFAENTRLRILRLLSMQEFAVTELVEMLGVRQSRVSRHLAVLRNAALVRDRREGNWVYYRLDADKLSPFARALWEAIRDDQAASQFFPADLQRLQDALARRKARSKAYFDAVRTEWDRIRRNYIDDVLSLVVASSLLRPNAVVADLGPGTGEMLVSLAPAAAKVIAVDNSESMLEVCRQRIERGGLENVELRQGDAESLPIADGECDTAFSSMLLHHLADPAAGVREMARIVRPGGRVVISDLVKHDCDWTREVMADVWLGFAEQQIRQWLAAAGLTDVQYSSAPVPSPREPDSQTKLRAFIATGTKPWKQADAEQTDHPITP
jgi:ubiquinone/menaquinone biosynthesis C-methylase UbiE